MIPLDLLDLCFRGCVLEDKYGVNPPRLLDTVFAVPGQTLVLFADWHNGDAPEPFTGFVRGQSPVTYENGRWVLRTADELYWFSSPESDAQAIVHRRMTLAYADDYLQKLQDLIGAMFGETQIDLSPVTGPWLAKIRGSAHPLSMTPPVRRLHVLDAFDGQTKVGQLVLGDTIPGYGRDAYAKGAPALLTYVDQWLGTDVKISAQAFVQQIADQGSWYGLRFGAPRQAAAVSAALVAD